MMYKILLLINFILLSVCLGFCVWLKQTSPKIAYVRSAVVVDGFQGVKEVRAAFHQKESQWQSEIDTLSARLNQSVQQYSQESSRLSETEKEQRKLMLTNQQAELQKHQSAVQQKATEQEDKLLQGALNQINQYVKEYAEQQGYAMVLGTTQSGNILYANEAVDITDEVLKGLNQGYHSHE
ncbi:MAG: OmpH family outer membrane protein [Bacteroidota bacterium]